jgi:deazaflavin-dependent oxidoreductase (nitroreductase family)
MTTTLSLVRASNPLSRRLLRLGMPMGPNVLLTVRGRTSGLPRSAAVAVVEFEGRRYVIGAYGDVQWTRNLRAAGEAEIRVRGHDEPVAARQLDRAEATDFYARILPAYVSRLPRFGQLFGRLLFGVAGPEIRDDPERAAITRPVFELRSTVD